MVDEKKIEKISWRAAEREHFNRGPEWYLSIGVGAVVLFVIAILTRNFFFGIFVLLAGCLVLTMGKSRPKVFDFEIDEKGITINGRIHHPFLKLNSFCLHNRPGRLDELILKKKTAINPLVRIPIDEKTAAQARPILEAHLPSFDHQDSILDLISDWLGF